MWDDFDLDPSDFDLLECSSTTEFDMEGLINAFENLCPKPMNQWSSREVLDFIYNEVLWPDEELIKVQLNRFSCISGYIFKDLTEEYCKILANCNHIGGLIFNAKEKYLNSAITKLVENKNFYETDDNKNLPVFGEYASTVDNDLNKSFAETSKKPGRPKCKPSSDKTGKKSEKLWEFLLHLLCDKKTCPELIKWENFEEGTFKFVQSDKVARLWGDRKKNENMTYEKFSRAMRYYYKNEVLLPVPGKRLVYKFGPQARGWRNVTPIV